MYTIRGDEQISIVSDLPRPDIGAPLPSLVVTEWGLMLMYITSSPDPDWDGTSVTVVGPQSAGESIAVVSFKSSAHCFGMPNDEAFSGHPLSRRGLESYAASEVRPSGWIDDRERMNGVHPMHRKEAFIKRRHIIIAFHDTTFEGVCRSYTVERFQGSIHDAMTMACERLGRA